MNGDHVNMQQHPGNLNSGVTLSTSRTFFPKVLLWMGLGIIITFLFAFFLPWILDVTLNDYTSLDYALYIMCGVGSVGVLIVSVVMMFKQFSVKGLGPIIYSVYAILMGLALCPLYVLFYNPIGTLGILYTLGVTSGIFIILGVVGWLFKGKLNALALIATGLIFGSLILSLVNMFVFNETVYWVTSFVILFAFLLYTAFDFSRVSALHASDIEFGVNVQIACALTLYTDFIVLFIRLLPIILRILAESRR